MQFSVIIPAAGIGRRMGGKEPKQYLCLGEKPLICHTLERFRRFEEVIVVVESGKIDQFSMEILEKYDFPAWKVVEGGEKRQDSVRNGLTALETDCDVVLIHDGVRPFVSPVLIEEVAKVAAEQGAAILAVPVRDTIKRVSGTTIGATVDRTELWQAQTPQAFRLDLLRTIFAAAYRDGYYGTDEASLCERLGEKVTVVRGDDRNLKITTPQDLAIAEALLSG